MPARAMCSVSTSAGATNRTNRPQVLLLAKGLQLRLHLLSRHVRKASGTKAMDSSDPSLVRRASAIRKVRTSSKSRRKRRVKTPSRPEKAGKTSVRSNGVARRQSAANPMVNSSGSAATKKLKVRSPAPRKASSKNRRATARRRAREKRVTPRAKATATHRAAKDRARTGEASRHSPAYSRLS